MGEMTWIRVQPGLYRRRDGVEARLYAPEKWSATDAAGVVLAVRSSLAGVKAALEPRECEIMPLDERFPIKHEGDVELVGEVHLCGRHAALARILNETPGVLR